MKQYPGQQSVKDSVLEGYPIVLFKCGGQFFLVQPYPSQPLLILGNMRCSLYIYINLHSWKYSNPDPVIQITAPIWTDKINMPY